MDLMDAWEPGRVVEPAVYIGREELASLSFGDIFRRLTGRTAVVPVVDISLTADWRRGQPYYRIDERGAIWFYSEYGVWPCNLEGEPLWL